MSCGCRSSVPQRDIAKEMAQREADKTGFKYVVYRIPPDCYDFIEKSKAEELKMNWIYETV
jgi:hypothetical protein